jgi:hypothetical protein
LADAPKALGTSALSTEAYADYFAYQVLESFDHLGTDPETTRKGQLPAALQTLSPDPLILRGAGMLNIFGPMEAFRQKFPRSKIHQLVRRFQTGKGEALRDAWASASTELRRAGLTDEFAILKEYFGGKAGECEIQEIITWVHIAELWDYAPPPRHWSAPPVPLAPRGLGEEE